MNLLRVIDISVFFFLNVFQQNSLQTFWVISGASLRTLSTVTVDESAASTSHAKVPQKPQVTYSILKAVLKEEEDCSF